MFRKFAHSFRRYLSASPVICNYDCEECMAAPNPVPNRAGRFFIINESECRCSGCGGVYAKSRFYSQPSGQYLPK